MAEWPNGALGMGLKMAETQKICSSIKPNAPG